MGRMKSIAGGKTWTRRSILETAGISAMACAMPNTLGSMAAAAIPTAVQLYSVRGDCGKDFDAALEQVAKIGFGGVEFAGYYNYEGKPKELRKRRPRRTGMGWLATAA